MTHTQEFIDVLDEVGVDYETNYSGRAMYGKTCVSVEFDYERDAFEMFSMIGAVDETMAIKAARSAKVDSMGTGIIVYWPSFRTDLSIQEG